MNFTVESFIVYDRLIIKMTGLDVDKYIVISFLNSNICIVTDPDNISFTTTVSTYFNRNDRSNDQLLTLILGLIIKDMALVIERQSRDSSYGYISSDPVPENNYRFISSYEDILKSLFNAIRPHGALATILDKYFGWVDVSIPQKEEYNEPINWGGVEGIFVPLF